ncbi:hypothetical protein RIF29_41144 [Crotalaria pallida]|uniref:Uncharacterized protein n=1 Tax=Crotalaria pallida TaxID=3830 RepID=A0AAN9E6S3_CROPI
MARVKILVFYCSILDEQYSWQIIEFHDVRGSISVVGMKKALLNCLYVSEEISLQLSGACPPCKETVAVHRKIDDADFGGSWMTDLMLTKFNFKKREISIMAMNIHALRKLLAAMEAEEAAMEAEEAAGKSTNHGTADSFNNYGDGNQNYSNSRINSGANSGDRYNRRTYNNHGDNAINNSGTFYGNGNGGNIGGNFDASTKNYRRY